jgi:mannosyltransferase OCH1-like enzyme
LRIAKRLGHIWIGPKEAPVEWMRTWTDLHPDWEYTFYDNAWLAAADLETRPQIDEYIRRGWYHGAADLMRYEILYHHGGYLAGSDSVCIAPVDELFEDEGTIYTVYENEFLRGQMVAPIVAAVPHHPFLRLLIDDLKQVKPRDLDYPWRQTGNLFVSEMIEKHNPDIVIWPSYTLIPEHFTGRKYTGEGKVYAHQMFGETTGRYKAVTWKAKLLERQRALYASMARKRLRAAGRLKKL